MNMIVAVLVHVVSSVATLQQINQQNGDLAAFGAFRRLLSGDGDIMVVYITKKWWSFLKIFVPQKIVISCD